MMRALDAGGIRALTDGVRCPDVDNPFGYFEYEPAKRMNADMSWLATARGRAVKIVYRLLYSLPSDYEYRLIFMRRDIVEVVASQNAMLRRLGQLVDDRADAELQRLFTEQISICESWIGTRPNFRKYVSDYRSVLARPRDQFRRISDFLETRLDLDAMQSCVDPSFYRKRRT